MSILLEIWHGVNCFDYVWWVGGMNGELGGIPYEFGGINCKVRGIIQQFRGIPAHTRGIISPRNMEIQNDCTFIEKRLK